MEYTKTIKDLPKQKCLATIKNRPWLVQISLAVIGVGIIVVASAYWYIGVLFLLLCGGSAFVTVDNVTCMIYKDRLAVFNPEDKNSLEIIMFENIVSYETDTKTLAFEALNIQETGKEEVQRLVIATYQAPKLHRKLLKLMPKKDYNDMKFRMFDTPEPTKEEKLAAKKLRKEMRQNKKAAKKAKKDKAG